MVEAVSPILETFNVISLGSNIAFLDSKGVDIIFPPRIANPFEFIMANRITDRNPSKAAAE